ncbi:MAG TPA: hypothetical protein VGI65_04825 [Steroidobacteraceae bacterium]
MIPRRTRFKLAILLALMLPLQGLSAASACASISASTAPTRHHCAPLAGTVSGSLLHHGCGTCCAVGVAAAPLNWAAPSLPSPEVCSVDLLPPPDIILDRLDRPPRHSI